VFRRIFLVLTDGKIVVIELMQKVRIHNTIMEKFKRFSVLSHTCLIVDSIVKVTIQFSMLRLRHLYYNSRNELRETKKKEANQKQYIYST
jgi:hypothetical protein